MQSVYLDWSFKTSLTKSAKNRLIFKDTLKFQIGISLTFLDGLHRNFAWWLTITSFIFLFFSCIINSQYFFLFLTVFQISHPPSWKKWVKPEVGLKCIYFLNNNVSSYVWVKFGINRSTCTIWLFLCTNRPYYRKTNMIARACMEPKIWFRPEVPISNHLNFDNILRFFNILNCLFHEWLRIESLHYFHSVFRESISFPKYTK